LSFPVFEAAAVKISIVVPAYNEEKLIATSLQKIAAASGAFRGVGWSTELIVCDNNSSDRTAEIAKQAGAKVVFEPVNQIARARNRGAAAAEGEWLVFVDADSHPSLELFGEVADIIRDGRYLAGGCTVKLDESHFVGALLVGGWNLLSRLTRWAAGSFIFCKASAFGALNGFSPDLFASEEIDLSRRLKKLARAEGKRMLILHRHPIITSARKLHLYSSGDHLRFLAKALFWPRRTVRNRDACPTWYNGRR
jgi:glycosyltransferase involved in cell wall biosynthesis